MTAFNIIKSLTKRGNAVVGSGCYSAAISASDSSKVIKIGNSMYDPWLDFYHIIIKPNQKNKCVPKVHSFYVDEASEFYVCVMERLEEHDNIKQRNSIADLCKDFTAGWIDEAAFLNIAANTEGTCDVVDDLLFILNKIKEHTHVFDYEYGQHYEGVRRLDMHAGNFMYRDGNIVVIDPWCEVELDDITDVSDWVYANIKHE